MKGVLVIGVGNTLRSDDGAGVRAAEIIADRFPEVDVLTIPALGPEHSETVACYRSVVFVDATAQGTEVTLSRLEGKQIPAPEQSHALSPERLLSLARLVFKQVPDETLLGAIPACTFDLGEELSPAAARNVEQFVQLFAARLLQLREGVPAQIAGAI